MQRKWVCPYFVSFVCARRRWRVEIVKTIIYWMGRLWWWDILKRIKCCISQRHGAAARQKVNYFHILDFSFASEHIIFNFASDPPSKSNSRCSSGRLSEIFFVKVIKTVIKELCSEIRASNCLPPRRGTKWHRLTYPAAAVEMLSLDSAWHGWARSTDGLNIFEIILILIARQ